MKFKDVTLDDIKNYFNNNNDFELVYAKYKKGSPNILDVFRFDGEYDFDAFVCSIYKKNITISLLKPKQQQYH